MFFLSSTIPVVYEDRWLLVVDKPAGLLSVPTQKNTRRTLTSVLNDELQKKDLFYRLHPCHRLDRETSGLLIYAKGKATQEKMMQEFKDKKIKKSYIAFVHGRLQGHQGVIKNRIGGKPALTQYQVLKQQRDFAVLEINPITGRKNQIRIHFKQIGYPIVGEDRFAFRKDFALKFKRLCLHAQRLEFRHPITKKNLSLVAPLSEELKDFLKKSNN